jgi:hypothetical protein
MKLDGAGVRIGWSSSICSERVKIKAGSSRRVEMSMEDHVQLYSLREGTD